MTKVLKKVPTNSRTIAVNDKQMMFHVPTTSLFELDELSAQLIEAADSESGLSVDKLTQSLSAQTAKDIDDTVEQLIQLKVVASNDAGVQAFEPDNPEVTQLENIPLTTLVLNVNTGCNLSCSYCYKEDLDTPANGQKMSFDTAKKSIEMMLAESPDQPRYNIVFFGGEPLSNMPLIREVVEYAQARFAELNVPIDFSLTTNATLLNEEIIEFFQKHKFGIAVSIDGPKAIHDKNRITVNGNGTYKAVTRKIELLMKGYNARPIGARVTLTKGVTDIEEIWQHLFHELGFAEVGFAPVTSGDISEYNLSEDELKAVFASMIKVGRHYIDEAKAGRNIGFSNMHQLMTDIHEGTKKHYRVVRVLAWWQLTIVAALIYVTALLAQICQPLALLLTVSIARAWLALLKRVWIEPTRVAVLVGSAICALVVVITKAMLDITTHKTRLITIVILCVTGLSLA